LEETGHHEDEGVEYCDHVGGVAEEEGDMLVGFSEIITDSSLTVKVRGPGGQDDEEPDQSRERSVNDVRDNSAPEP
jgi:hypothetical protein